MTTQPSHPTYQPNQYDLFSKRVHVTYATTGIDGKPRLTYLDKGSARSFAGDQIRLEETSIGRLVSVTLEVVPDLHTISFSFLLPMLNIEREAHVVTEGVYTTARSSIGGPALVKGEFYQFRAVSWKSGVPLSSTEDLRGVWIAD